MHFQMFVGDFGLADAFREFGHNNGSRPYMAPEQFSAAPFDGTAPNAFDVFALGVIAFECLTDGIHPLGVTTTDVWPWREKMPQKWNRESTWRKWAEGADKSLPATVRPLPCGMADLRVDSLSADPAERPSLEEFENRLWQALGHFDDDTRSGFQAQVNAIEGLSMDDEWPHMDERLGQLRHFYSTL